MIRARSLLAAPLLAAALTAVVPAAAHAVTVGPGQYFSGGVNATTSGTATIQTNCFGPTFPGETGNPLAGQYVTAQLASAAGSALLGYTGTAADAIAVSLKFSSLTGTGSAFVGAITTYGVKVPIPTTITVPCYGNGTAVFDPTPTSATAKDATVAVTFVGQP